MDAYGIEDYNGLVIYKEWKGVPGLVNIENYKFGGSLPRGRQVKVEWSNQKWSERK